MSNEGGIALPPRPAPMSARNTEHLKYTPTIFEFSKLSAHDQIEVTRFRHSICGFWDLLSPSSVFPLQYLPDPDSRNWGTALMESLNKLAELTRRAYRKEAVHQVVQRMKVRNEDGVHRFRNFTDGEITAAMVMKGDFVIRVDDVEFALTEMWHIIAFEKEYYTNHHQYINGYTVWRSQGGSL
ncbi:hypothetical protein GMOD_00002720 [Pyrenophora seminiperda CCB06]|uniref:Uncharacterized protein n=1 Tax=Pyrenophora seminiperda CCB06 TaxID=1302712 RepID=A0A3M7M381_9PLEO|nr:hypothetical protein GMOD_00002720 [Pyrenophora seminiperda CCB06]